MALFIYLYVTLVGFSIAAAVYNLASVIGAPRPQPLPISAKADPAVVVPLWLFAGPVALLRNNFIAYLQGRFRAPRFVGVAFAFLWAFCLGVFALELAFRLTHFA